MAYYAVSYTYSDDKQTQDANRPEHRAFLGALAEQGTVVASGPLLGTTPSTALLILKGDSADEVRGILTDDPFQKLSQVTQVEVTEWNPVIGILAGN